MKSQSKQKQGLANRVSAIAFFLWGLLHIYAGMLVVTPFIFAGPASALQVFGIQLVPPLNEAILIASHVALNFGFDLAGYGVLAVWLATYIWNGHQVTRNFILLVVMLGIADGAFIYSLLIPGYSPLLEGIVGPVLYGLGLAFGIYGIYVQKK